MDIDMGALRALEREKEISFPMLVEAIESALLIAYQRTEGHQPTARVELERKSGHVTVWAAETDDEGTVLREYDDTPTGFGRIAATTAKLWADGDARVALANSSAYLDAAGHLVIAWMWLAQLNAAGDRFVDRSGGMSPPPAVNID